MKAYLKADVVISAVIFVTALYLFFETNAFGSGDVYGKLGPAYWPRFVLVSIMALSVGVAAISIKCVMQGTIPPARKLEFSSSTVRFISAVSLIATYFILLPYVGFLVLTPIQMIAFMYLLGERKKAWIFSVPFVMTICIVLLFTKFMYVPLPRGIGIFLQISHLLY